MSVAPTTTTLRMPLTRWRTLVFGGVSGWIGQTIVRMMREQNYDVKATSVRMEDRAKVEALLDEFKPDRVFIAAGTTGRPNVDWCESNKAETVRANVIGTLNAIDACNSNGRSIHVTYYGTGCIYQGYGENGAGFKEDDAPNFAESFYSRSKVTCEAMIREAYNDNVLTLRLRMPISDDLHPRSFVTKITRYDRVVNVPNSMSVLEELLPVSIDMAMRKRVGVYNFCNPGVITHNEILQLYKEIVDPTFQWRNFSLEEQAKVIKAGRSNNKLDVTKLMSEYPTQIQEIHVAVANALRRGQKK